MTFTIPIDNGDAVKNAEADSQRTLCPYVTGTSIVAIKYKDGVLMASDMGGSYGSTLRYKNIERIKAIGKHSLLGASGEISDFQEILRYLDELILNDNMWDDGNSLGPKEVHNYLTRVMYNRRNKFNPLWNTLVLGGVKNGKSYLGMVSMIGVSFEDNHVATGSGNHLARPILRDEWHADLSFEDGVKLLEKCMRVLLYRDRSAINKFQGNEYFKQKKFIEVIDCDSRSIALSPTAVQRLLEAEKRRLLAEIELGSIFGKMVDVDNDVDKRSVKIELIDDTLLVNVVSKRPGSAYTDKELPRKHKKIGVKAKVSDVHSCGENNGEQFRRLYPREQLESMRFAHIVNQRKVWSEMYGRLLPEVVTEYESLVCLKNHKTSKSNLVRGKGQKESGIGENLGTEEGMEDLNGEDYTDDNDDYKSILKPAFAVDGEPDFSTGPPEDGLEYLRRVRWEAKGFPNVKIAKIDESKYIKKEQSVYMPLIPEIPKCPEYLLPVKEWEDLLISDFLHLRQALSQNADSCEDEIISNQSVEDLLIEIFNKRLHIENDESFGGMVSEIQGMDSVTRISKLKKRICLVEKVSGIESSDCKWVVALCASLDTPLDADTSACLRGLLRKCAIVRAEKSLEVGDEEVTTMASILITIAGRYFGQMGQ